MSSRQEWGTGAPAAVPRPGRLWAFLSALVSDECRARPSRTVIDVPVVDAPADMTTCEHLRTLYEHSRELISARVGRFLIDLGGVRQADTKLVACLVAIHRAARMASVEFEILASDIVLDHIRVCRLDRLLERTRAAKQPTR